MTRAEIMTENRESLEPEAHSLVQRKTTISALAELAIADHHSTIRSSIISEHNFSSNNF